MSTLEDRLDVFSIALRKAICQRDGVPEAYIKTNSVGWLKLLNLEVWSKRYCVSLSWIVAKLQEWYVKTKREPGTLGIPIAAATGVAARLRIEKTVDQLYPSGENHRQTLTTQLSFPERSKSLGEYHFRMTRHKRRAAVLREQPQRPWRGNPWQ